MEITALEPEHIQMDNEKELILLYTQKPVQEVLNDYDVTQLLKVSAYLIFIKNI